jgi:O-antigen ligase
MIKLNTAIKQDYLNITTAGFFGLMLIATALGPRLWGFAPAIFGLLGYLYARGTTGEWLRMPKVYIVLAIGSAALAASSYLWSDYPDSVIDRVDSLAPVLLGGGFLLAAASKIDFTPRGTQLIFGGFIIGLLIVAFNLHTDMALHRLTHGTLPTEEMPIHQMNRPLCAFMVMFWPVLYMLRTSDIRKSAGALLGSFMLLALVFSSSQSAQVAIVLSTIFYLLFPYARRFFAWALFAGVVFVTIAMPFVMPEIFDIIKNMERPENNSNMGYPFLRIEIWAMISDAVHQKFWLGYGVEATRNMHFDWELVNLEHNNILHPHNMTLQMWIEFGAFGAAVFLAGLFYLFKQIRKLPDAAQAIAFCTFICIYSIANTGYGIWQSWWVGVIVAVVGFMRIVFRR